MSLTAKKLKELVVYDASTGIFTSRISRRGVIAGQRLGNINAAGYVLIGLKYKRYYGHRLAWLYVHGKWPEFEIDHENVVRDDNRIANLRAATSGNNKQNQGRRKDNRSGYKWVWAHQGKFRAAVKSNGKKHDCGLYGSPEEAHLAAAEIAKREHGKYARAG